MATNETGAASEAPELSDPHPGGIILEDFLKPYRMTPYRLAKGLGVPPTRVAEILKRKRAITADTALRLSRLLGCTPEFWLGLQASHDLRTTRGQLGGELEQIVPYPHEGPIWLDGEPHHPQKSMAELEAEHVAALAEAQERGSR